MRALERKKAYTRILLTEAALFFCSCPSRSSCPDRTAVGEQANNWRRAHAKEADKGSHHAPGNSDASHSHASTTNCLSATTSRFTATAFGPTSNASRSSHAYQRR